MRKNFYILLFSLFLIFIFGCTQERNDGINETINQTCETENVDDYDSEPTVVSLPNDTGNETKVVLPPHSELYLPGYTQEQIVEYFKEVILNVEYSDGTGSDDDQKIKNVGANNISQRDTVIAAETCGDADRGFRQAGAHRNYRQTNDHGRNFQLSGNRGSTVDEAVSTLNQENKANN